MQKLVGEGVWGFWKAVKVGQCGGSRKNKHEHGGRGGWKVKEGPDYVVSMLRIWGHERPVKYFKEEDHLFKCVF